MKITFTLNGQSVEVDAPAGANLLWTLRDGLGLTGTKYGCGIAQCGVCTVHLNGQPIRACVTPLQAIQGKQVTTIEGLGAEALHPLQEAWITAQVPQCGYCQSGQIMQAAALLAKTPSPTKAEIIKYMDGVLCRCGTYLRILKAIQSVAKINEDASSKSEE